MVERQSTRFLSRVRSSILAGGTLCKGGLVRRLPPGTTSGRRTGKQRTVPLTYLCDGVDLVVVGSFGGSDRAPAWWLNLEHDRRAAVQLDGVTIAVSARWPPRPSGTGCERW